MRQPRREYDETASGKPRSTDGKERKFELYDALLPFTHLEATPASIVETSARLGMNEAAVKMAICRLRPRLREAVTETLGPDDDLEAEMLHLRSLLANPGQVVLYEQALPGFREHLGWNE